MTFDYFVAIRSPFKHQVPLSSETQPVRPVLPLDSDNTYSADSTIADAIDPDAKVYKTQQIDIPKADTVYVQAKSLASLVVDARTERSVVSSLISGASFANSSNQADYVFSHIGHPGYGSCSARVETYMIFEYQITADVACLVDADNTVEAEAGGVITIYPDRVEVTRDCSGYVSDRVYEIVDFRWKDNDTADNPFGNSCDSTSLTFTEGHYYELAVRIRTYLHKTESTGSSDWLLEWTKDIPSLNNWTSVFSAGSVGFFEQTWDVDANWPYIPVSTFVTTPGPGIIKEVQGVRAQPSNESFPYYEAEKAQMIESEVRYALYLTGSPSIATKPVYFRLRLDDAEVPGGRSASMHPILNLPWISIVV